MPNITNLSQLKKAIDSGAHFEIVEHYIKPELTGQKRKPNVIQTNGFYSVVPDEPENIANTWNGGRGSWFAYGKASDWTFDKTGYIAAPHGHPCWKIRITT